MNLLPETDYNIKGSKGPAAPGSTITVYVVGKDNEQHTVVVKLDPSFDYAGIISGSCWVNRQKWTVLLSLESLRPKTFYYFLPKKKK